MVIDKELILDLLDTCDFSEDFAESLEGDFEIDGLSSSDVQRINKRVESSVKQQEVRQGKSRKVASRIFSN